MKVLRKVRKPRRVEDFPENSPQDRLAIWSTAIAFCLGLLIVLILCSPWA